MPTTTCTKWTLPRWTLGRGTIAASMLLGAVAAAHAQDATNVKASQSAAETTALEEVIVTATRREASLADVPMAVTAISGETLAQFGIISMQDVSKLVPAATIQSRGASQQQIIIRGIASEVGATTGVYLDEAPLIGGFDDNIHGDGTPGLRLHDLDRIEALKGPQGTLFGSGSMAGTLRVVTAKPDLKNYSTYVAASGANVEDGDGFYTGDLTVNLPVISDVFGLRAVGWVESGGGYIDQTISGVTRKNVNNQHVGGGRLTALWKATDRLSFTASANYQEVSVSGSQNWIGDLPDYQTDSPTQEKYKDRYALYTLLGSYTADFGSFIASGTYGDKHNFQPNDSTPTAAFFGLPFATSFIPIVDYHDWTAETRFSSTFQGPFQLVAGVYYQDDSTRTQQAAIISDPTTGLPPCRTAIGCAAAGLTNPGNNFDGTVENTVLFATRQGRRTEQRAFYAQGDYQFRENLTFATGIRYFSAKIHQNAFNIQDIAPSDANFCSFVVGCVTTPYKTFDGRDSESKTTYNVSVLWKPNVDLSLYARAASGFRLGGINAEYFSARQFSVEVPFAFEPDTLRNYELGVKAYFLERSLYADFSVYHIDWLKQQLVGQAEGAFGYTLNAGKTKTDGAELELNFRPTNRLRFSGSVTYVHARLGEDLPEAIADAGSPGFTGDRLPRVPRWSGSFQGEYVYPLAGQAEGYGQLGVAYRGDSYVGFNSQNEFYIKLPSYALIDLKFGARWDRYDVSVFAQNLGNKTAYAGLEVDPDGVRVFSSRPRTVGLAVSAQF